MFHKGESVEDYLETILRLSRALPAVRSIDVVHDTGYSKPSVSVAMKNLRENGFIDVMGDGSIILLEPGKEIAENLYKRHTILTQALITLGVSKETATEDACKIEHRLSEESFDAIKKHMENFNG